MSGETLARLEVVEPGLGVTLQDRGRHGYRQLGVPVSGALDEWLMAAANALVDNPLDAPALEILLAGPVLRAVSGTLRVAVAGGVGAQVVKMGGQCLELPPCTTALLRPGDLLRVGGVPTQGPALAYLAVSGGILLPPQLGSRATYLRAGLGGVHGRGLARGDLLPVRPVSLAGNPWLETVGAGWADPAGVGHWLAQGPIRVIPGPQLDHFTPEAVKVFFAEPWFVTREKDRMGMRLEGAPLLHGEKGADIISDGVTPGAIQVPANGQPIVLLADCQTTGGYPKIATVIRADLPRLAHLRPGDTLRFTPVTLAEAAAAWQAQTQGFSTWQRALGQFLPPGLLDEAALYGGNLVSGVIRGDELDSQTAW